MSDEKNENQKKWFLRKEFYGAVITSTAPILLLFPEHTVAFKVGISLNALAGGILAYLGVTKGYKAKNLPGQENSKLAEGISNTVTNIVQKTSLAFKKLKQ